MRPKEQMHKENNIKKLQLNIHNPNFERKNVPISEMFEC
jgi:hypothetical protein